MEPLATAPRALLRSIEGVIFDVDDTLTTHGLLPAEAYRALFRLRNRGLGAMAVTGRPLGWADAMAATWPIDLAVGENGAGWARCEKGRLLTGTFEEVDLAAREALRAAVRSELPYVREASDQPARRCDVAWDVGEVEPLPEDEVHALVSLIESHGALALVSSVHAHAALGAWDKAVGARHAVDASGAKAVLDRWVFVGDSGNDAAAFASFPLSVGVANVVDHLHRLPTPPRWVTRAERSAGFVELVDALMRAHDA